MPRLPGEDAFSGIPSARSGRPIAREDTSARYKGAMALGRGLQEAGAATSDFAGAVAKRDIAFETGLDEFLESERQRLAGALKDARPDSRDTLLAGSNQNVDDYVAGLPARQQRRLGPEIEAGRTRIAETFAALGQQFRTSAAASPSAAAPSSTGTPGLDPADPDDRDTANAAFVTMLGPAEDLLSPEADEEDRDRGYGFAIGLVREIGFVPPLLTAAVTDAYASGNPALVAEARVFTEMLSEAAPEAAAEISRAATELAAPAATPAVPAPEAVPAAEEPAAPGALAAAESIGLRTPVIAPATQARTGLDQITPTPGQVAVGGQLILANAMPETFADRRQAPASADDGGTAREGPAGMDLRIEQNEVTARGGPAVPPAPGVPSRSQALVDELVRRGAVLQSEAGVLEEAIRTGDRATVTWITDQMEDRAAAAADIGDEQAADTIRAARVFLGQLMDRITPTGDPEAVTAAAQGPVDHAVSGAATTMPPLQGGWNLAGGPAMSVQPGAFDWAPPIVVEEPAMTAEQIREAAIRATATMLGGPPSVLPAAAPPAEPAIGTSADPPFQPVWPTIPGDLSHLLPSLKSWAADKSLDEHARQFMQDMIDDIETDAVTPAVLERYVRYWDLIASDGQPMTGTWIIGTSIGMAVLKALGEINELPSEQYVSRNGVITYPNATGAPLGTQIIRRIEEFSAGLVAGFIRNGYDLVTLPVTLAQAIDSLFGGDPTRGFLVDQVRSGQQWLDENITVPDTAFAALGGIVADVGPVGLGGWAMARHFDDLLGTARVGPAILSSGSTRSRYVDITDPPSLPPRPFVADYPQAATPGGLAPQYVDPGTGRLLLSTTGQPLRAQYVAGRTTLNAADQAVPTSAYEDIARALTGRPVRYAGWLRMRGDRGQIVVDRNYRPVEIRIRRDLPADVQARALAEEIGHAVDFIAGQIPIDGIEGELRHVFRDLRGGFDPERFPAYAAAPDVIPRELMANAISAYLSNPNYFKTVAPNTAARIREYWNNVDQFADQVQFNALLPPLLVAPMATFWDDARGSGVGSAAPSDDG